MKRRSMLALLGSALTAGCVGDSDGTADGAPAPADGGAEPTSTTPAPPQVDADGAELVTHELAGQDQAGAVADVTNASDSHLGIVQTSAEFYAVDGTLLESYPWDVRSLEPGETWRPYMGAASTPEEIADVAVVVSDAMRLQRTPDPAGLSVTDTELRVPEVGHPRVLGAVENRGGETVYADARPKLYDGQGRVLGTGIGVVQQLGSGQTWSFDVQIPLGRQGRAEQIDDHSVVVTS